MARRYKNHAPALKLKVAIEAAQNQKPVNQIASKNGIAPAQVTEWKKQLLEEGAQMFRSKRRAKILRGPRGYKLPATANWQAYSPN